VAFRLVTGGSFQDIDTGIVDGRVDLRGFSLPPPSVINRIELGRLSGAILDGVIWVRSNRWEDLDLSFSILPNLRFVQSTLFNCVFENADCRDWRFWECAIARSRFVDCDMRDSLIGSSDVPHNTWTGVTFDHVDFRGAVMLSAEFRDCDFVQNNFESVQFNGCLFDSVRFSGLLKDVRFDSRAIPNQRPDLGPMTAVDFSAATLADVEYWGCRFLHVEFPDNSGVIVFPNAAEVARRQLEQIRGDDSEVARRLRVLLENRLKFPGREDAQGVFFKADWDTIEGMANFAESNLLEALRESRPSVRGLTGWVSRLLK
jgi:uncharacterized protein YjbI with pentapeptide repeats